MAKQNTPDSGRPNLSKGDEPGLSKAAQRAARAAAANAEMAARKRKEQMRRAGLYGVGLIALIAIVVVLVFVGKNHSSSNSDTATGMPAIGKSKYGFTVGNPSAPHTIIFYEDFLCPHCGHVERASEAGLDAAAKAGKVYIEYRPFNLLAGDGTYSEQADNAFEAVREIAGDTVALAYHNLLFKNQPAEPGPADGRPQLIQWADQVVPAADQQKVADAINNNTYASFVSAETAEAEGPAGVNSTPTIYFDGSLYSNTSGNATGEFAPDDNMGANLVKAVQ